MCRLLHLCPRSLPVQPSETEEREHDVRRIITLESVAHSPCFVNLLMLSAAIIGHSSVVMPCSCYMDVPVESQTFLCYTLSVRHTTTIHYHYQHCMPLCPCRPLKQPSTASCEPSHREPYLHLPYPCTDTQSVAPSLLLRPALTYACISRRQHRPGQRVSYLPICLMTVERLRHGPTPQLSIEFLICETLHLCDNIHCATVNDVSLDSKSALCTITRETIVTHQ